MDAITKSPVYDSQRGKALLDIFRQGLDLVSQRQTVRTLGHREAYLGMSDRLPNLCYYNNEEYAFTKPYSDDTARTIDDEVKKLVNEQYERAKRILSEYAEGHRQLADLLIEKEVIFSEDLERIFGKRKWGSRAEEIVDNIVNERLMLDQFSDCDITMKEIDAIKSTIITTYLGIRHKRVKYPEINLK